MTSILKILRFKLVENKYHSRALLRKLVARQQLINKLSLFFYNINAVLVY